MVKMPRSAPVKPEVTQVGGIICETGSAQFLRRPRRYRQEVRCHCGVIHALSFILQEGCFAPLLVFAAGILVQRIIALQRCALHQLHSRELLPIMVLS